MRKRAFVLLVLVVGLVLGGCRPYRSSRTCEEIAAADLRALIEETTSLEQAATQVTEAFHVAAEDQEITRAPNNPDHCSLSWRANGVHYEIVWLSSKVLWARMRYESDAPSADEAIECLGAPDKYWAYYYPAFESPLRPAVLDLYFPALGVTCWGDKYGIGDRPPQFDGSAAMGTFYFVPLGPLDEVLKQLIEQGFSEGREWIKEGVKPWPGDWRKVEVQTGPPG